VTDLWDGYRSVRRRLTDTIRRRRLTNEVVLAATIIDMAQASFLSMTTCWRATRLQSNSLRFLSALNLEDSETLHITEHT